MLENRGKTICETQIRLSILYGRSELRRERGLTYRYAFRKDQAIGEPIEIEDDDDIVDPSRKFYWNPYSGELSLDFPKSENNSRGGILADAMG